MPRRCLVVLGVLVSLGARAAPVQTPAKNPPPPRVSELPESEQLRIDGSKNPELIPQWSAWGFMFRLIANGPGALPREVHLLVTKEQTALVLKEAQALQIIDRACMQRAARFNALLGTESPASLDAKLRALTVECRVATLKARDRVLAALSPEAAAVLRQSVEETKATTSTTIAKKDLARWLEPE